MKKISLLLLSMICLFSFAKPTYAYDANVYEHDEEVWFVTNNHDAPYKVVMYAVIQPKYYQYGHQYGYNFTCLDGNFSNGQTFATMEYAFYEENEPVAELDAGFVFREEFGLEEGTYSFEGTTGNPIVIPFDFQTSPFPKTQEEYLELSNSYIMNIPDDFQELQEVHIYTMIGDYDWASENYNEFLEYSAEIEQKKLENYHPELKNQEDEENETIEPEFVMIDEYSYKGNNQHEHRYTNEDGKIVTETEDCIYTDNICEKCKNVLATTIQTKETNTKGIVQLILGIGILLAIVVVAKIRRR